MPSSKPAKKAAPAKKTAVKSVAKKVVKAPAKKAAVKSVAKKVVKAPAKKIPAKSVERNTKISRISRFYLL